MELQTIISGGQTGVDIAALKAAHLCGMKTGGNCPSEYRTSGGTNPLLIFFGLKPLPPTSGPLSAQYVTRSCMNVDAADATLAFRFKESVGTDKTIEYAKTGKWGNHLSPLLKPVLVISSLEEVEFERIRAFLMEHHVKTLNICGHRDVCYEKPVYDFLIKLFKK